MLQITTPSAAFHGMDGPLTVEQQSFVAPAAFAFQAAGMELGYSIVDINAQNSEGKFYVSFAYFC